MPPADVSEPEYAAMSPEQREAFEGARAAYRRSKREWEARRTALGLSHEVPPSPLDLPCISLTSRSASATRRAWRHSPDPNPHPHPHPHPLPHPHPHPQELEEAEQRAMIGVTVSDTYLTPI